MQLDVQINGMEDAIEFFNKLPTATRRKAIMPSLVAGGNVVKKMASDNIKAVVSNEATGTAAKSVAVYGLKKNRGKYRVSVQIKKGATNKKKIINGQPVRVGLYASVLEYRDGGKYSWIRKAAREGSTPALEEIRKTFSTKIDDIVKEAKK